MKNLHFVTLAAGAALTAAFTLPADPALGTLTGSVTFADAGKVVFDGEKPEMKPIQIDAAKAEGCGKVDTTDQSLLIGANGGIANVVVLVEVAGSVAKVPDKPVVLDQKTCRFEPHVSIVAAGTTVEFKNSDTIGHNVHTYPSKNDEMNKQIPPSSSESRKLDKEDRIEIKCDIHPWMNSYLIVTATPFYAVTGADGSFKIDGLPAGEHKAKLWHEKLGKAEAMIKVGADGKVEPVEVKMSMEKKAGGGRRK